MINHNKLHKKVFDDIINDLSMLEMHPKFAVEAYSCKTVGERLENLAMAVDWNKKGATVAECDMRIDILNTIKEYVVTVKDMLIEHKKENVQ